MKPEPPKTVTMRAAMIDLDWGEPALPRRRCDRRYSPQSLVRNSEKPVDFSRQLTTIAPSVAQVAELADAKVSGTCGRKVVEFRFFSWSPSPVARPPPSRRHAGV